MQADRKSSKFPPAAAALVAAITGLQVLAQSPASEAKPERPVGSSLGTAGVRPTQPQSETTGSAASSTSTRAETKASTKALARTPDALITKEVEAKLNGNQNVRDGAFMVETMSGTVNLSGIARDASEKETAGKIAKTVPGVRDVKNQITVRP